MKYPNGCRVLLKDTETGFDDWYDSEYPYSSAQWEEGNYSCDCNRSLFLYGLDLNDSFPCNTEKNRIIIVRREGKEDL